MRTLRLALCGLSLCLITACNDTEVRAVRPFDEYKVVTIAVGSDSWEQVVLGELYKQALERRGREATVSLHAGTSTEEILHSMSLEEADLHIACVGVVVDAYDPVAADKIRKEMKAEDVSVNDGKWREEAYSLMMASVETNLKASDPSNAIGCSDEDTGLPQNIVPIYRSPVLPRGARNTLNIVSGALTTETYEQLIEDAQAKGSAVEVVSKFLDSHSV